MPKPRLCVWARKDNREEKNIRGPQRGDVVDIIWNNQHPGNAVYGNSDWRIVDVDIQVDNPIKYMGWIIESDDVPEGWLKWFRKWSINLDKLEKDEEKSLKRPLANDDVIVIDVKKIKGLAKMKLSLPDPRIIR